MEIFQAPVFRLRVGSLYNGRVVQETMARLGGRALRSGRKSQQRSSTSEGDNPMISDFMRRKHNRFFDLVDADKRGKVAEADFFRILSTISAAFHLEKGSAKAERLGSAWSQMWKETFAPMSVDGQVTQDGLSAGLTRLAAEDPAAFRRILDSTAEAFLAMADVDGDGKVSEWEYTLVFASTNLPEAYAREAFRRLDLDNSGSLDLDEYRSAILEYLTSEDPSSPGNWLLGPL